jgi:ParB family chromosome partitioning protein
VGIIIEEINPKFSGSMYESFLKKVDAIAMDKPVSEAFEERKIMAQKLNELHEIINDIYDEIGIRNGLIKSEIFRKAFQGVYGKRVRAVEDDYYIAIGKIMDYLNENRDKIISEIKNSVSV